jgi:hypothetical protein
MRPRGNWWRSPPVAAALALALTALSAIPIVLLVDAFGLLGFWLVMSAAVVFPPWLHFRSRQR